MTKVSRIGELPEVTRYTKYYEHDGMIRAYANRAMVLAMIFGVLAMASLGFAIYVRLQPPTVIHVDKDGNASVVGGPHPLSAATFHLSANAFSADDSTSVAPTDLEGRAVVRQFLSQYLAYTPDSVDRNLAEALNMMTGNLRVYSMNRLRDEDTVGKIKNDHVISDFEIRSIEHVKGHTVDLHHLRREGSAPGEERDRGDRPNRRTIQRATGRNDALGSESERTPGSRIRRTADGR